MDLTEYNDMYEDAEVQDEFSSVPDGKYQVFVDEVPLKETKETHLPMLAWKFKIMTGPQNGRFLFKNSVIKDTTIGYVKTDLSICGLILKKFSDLPSKLKTLLNVQLEVKVANKGDNQNVYIQRKIEVDVEAEDEDEIPF